MTKAVPICLIEKNILFREGLKKLLADTGFEIVETHSGFETVGMNRQKDVALTIIGGEDGTDDLPKAVGSAKTIFPGSRIVVLAANSDPGHVASCFEAGADGYIMRDTSPSAITGALNMVTTGEKVYPAILLKTFMKKAANGYTDKGRMFQQYPLSARELQILEHLSDGKTNKQIAIGLEITEATVKVHVKTILRKLRLANRTQAAIWAVNEGLGGQRRVAVAG